jgi:hypothetical protein
MRLDVEAADTVQCGPKKKEDSKKGMETLPILVPVVAAVLCIPGVLFCGCYRNLSARLSALEGRVDAVAAAAAAASPPASSGYIGGVTYNTPAPSAPAAASIAYPVYLTPTRLPPPQPQPQPYWTPQPRPGTGPQSV